MSVKVNSNVVAVAQAVKDFGRAGTYAEVCAFAGRSFGPGVFTQAVKEGRIKSADASFKCDIVRQDTGAKVGTCTKTVKVYFVENA